MSLIFVFISFASAFLLVLLVKIILMADKKTAPIGIVNANKCANTAIPPAVFNKVSNIYSPPNEPFRPDAFSTCLEYLHSQEIDAGNKNENTILTCLGGKL
jgi:hypothetical protein